MSYIIGSGYHCRSDWDSQFSRTWFLQTNRYDADKFIVSTTNALPFCSSNIHEILVNNNIGHIGGLIANNTGGICGWSASVMLLAMVAYNAGKDLVYIEQDVLFKGDIVGQAYRDMGDRAMVFGRKMVSKPFMSCSQSLFIVRHNFLLEFVSRYLALPDDKDMLPEAKFVHLETQTPHKFARLSFGCERERPIPWDDELFYAQQITPSELQEAKDRGVV